MAESERVVSGLQRRLFDECETAGWDPEKRNTFAEEIAHLHEEVSEAFRAWRLRKSCEVWQDDDGKPQGVPIEFADVLIGLFYNAELHGFDLMEAVETKHRWNLRRSYVAEARQLHPVSDKDPRQAAAWESGFVAGVQSESIFGGLEAPANPYQTPSPATSATDTTGAGA